MARELTQAQADRRRKARSDRKERQQSTFSTSGAGPGIRDLLIDNVLTAYDDYRTNLDIAGLDPTDDTGVALRRGKLEGALQAYRTYEAFIGTRPLERKRSDTLKRIRTTYPRWRTTADPDRPYTLETE